jgi:hypothetical protein
MAEEKSVINGITQGTTSGRGDPEIAITSPMMMEEATRAVFIMRER